MHKSWLGERRSNSNLIHGGHVVVSKVDEENNQAIVKALEVACRSGMKLKYYHNIFLFNFRNNL